MAAARNEEDKAGEPPLVKAAAVWADTPRGAPASPEAALEGVEERPRYDPGGWWVCKGGGDDAHPPYAVSSGACPVCGWESPVRANPSVAATWNVGAERTLEKLTLKVPATMADWARFTAWGERMNQPNVMAAFHALLDEAGA